MDGTTDTSAKLSEADLKPFEFNAGGRSRSLRGGVLDALTVFEGAHFVGSGYDLVRGDPGGSRDGSVDTGFRRSVLQMEARNRVECTQLRGFACTPSFTFHQSNRSCPLLTDTRMVKIVHEYADQLRADAQTIDLTAAMPASCAFARPLETAAFQASAGYQHLLHDAVDESSSVFMLKAACPLVEGRVTLQRASSSAWAKLESDEFRRQRERLPHKFPPCSTADALGVADDHEQAAALSGAYYRLSDEEADVNVR